MDTLRRVLIFPFLLLFACVEAIWNGTVALIGFVFNVAFTVIGWPFYAFFTVVEYAVNTVSEARFNRIVPVIGGRAPYPEHTGGIPDGEGGWMTS